MGFSAIFNRIGSNEAALAELERYGFQLECPRFKRFDVREYNSPPKKINGD